MYTIGLGDLHVMEKLKQYMVHQIFCSRRRPVEQSYWTSNRYFTGCPVELFIVFPNRNSIGNPLDQMIWAIRFSFKVLGKSKSPTVVCGIRYLDTY